MLYSNYEAELAERFSADLATYAQSFNPVKEKINKRRRKLLDYDNARHDYDSIRSSRKPDDIKITKVCAMSADVFRFLSQPTGLD